VKIIVGRILPLVEKLVAESSTRQVGR
jgi:hypothetical protein